MWYWKLTILDFETPLAATAETTRDDAVTAAVTAAEYAVAAATACGNRVITRRLRGGREWRFEIENCKFPISLRELSLLRGEVMGYVPHSASTRAIHAPLYH